MYITKAQLDSRLKGNLELHVREGMGRKHTIPHETKALIGTLAKFDSQKNVAKEFETSQPNVSYISRGIDGEKINPELKRDIELSARFMRDKVSERAVDVLMRSIGIVDDKLENVKDAETASSVAKNLATIADKMRPIDSNNNQATRILINIHGTKQKSEDDFEVIEVSA
jgi:hypothetical protein